MRNRETPPAARHLTTYKEIESYLKDFARGLYPFLWVVGRPGIGKTESIRSALRGRDVYYRQGWQLTPVQFFVDCHQPRGRRLVPPEADERQRRAVLHGQRRHARP